MSVEESGCCHGETRWNRNSTVVQRSTMMFQCPRFGTWHTERPGFANGCYWNDRNFLKIRRSWSIFFLDQRPCDLIIDVFPIMADFQYYFRCKDEAFFSTLFTQILDKMLRITSSQRLATSLLPADSFPSTNVQRGNWNVDPSSGISAMTCNLWPWNQWGIGARHDWHFVVLKTFSVDATDSTCPEKSMFCSTTCLRREQGSLSGNISHISF